MTQFRIKSTVQIFDTTKEFIESFQVGAGDLIITISYTYEKYLKGLTGDAIVVDLLKYGTGEPNDGMVEAILCDISRTPYGRVIAIGGGTVLDVAKLFVLKNISPVQELFERKLDIIKEKILITVPTTCGTGSEITNISILELLNKKTKLGLAVDELFADDAVLIPELLETLPFGAFVASSIDAFIHAVESYLSPKANAFTEMFSVKAMELILNGYQVIAAQGREARIPLMKDFLIASNYAGIAFGNAGCAAVHALSYPLGSVFHVPHGEANYAILYGVFHKYMKVCPEGKIKILNEFLAKLLDCKVETVYQEMEELFNALLPRKSLSKYGVTRAQLEEFTESVMTNQGRLMANNYVTLSKADVYEIYNSLY